uniref:Uncharacterized protein n=1 Tax=Anopheles minimus TaxID=112268 RepID=A0A182WNF8_9DIPT
MPSVSISVPFPANRADGLCRLHRSVTRGRYRLAASTASVGYRFFFCRLSFRRNWFSVSYCMYPQQELLNTTTTTHRQPRGHPAAGDTDPTHTSDAEGCERKGKRSLQGGRPFHSLCCR